INGYEKRYLKSEDELLRDNADD
ncbi:hypothetical protein CEXT_14241, partial [Caerostris extrusa]